MGLHRRASTGTDRRRTGTAARAHAAPPAPPECRIVTGRDGARWLVTVIARLVPEQDAAASGAARLVLRVESIPELPVCVRIVTVRARALHGLSDDTLVGIAAAASSPARGPLRRRSGEAR